MRKITTIDVSELDVDFDVTTDKVKSVRLVTKDLAKFSLMLGNRRINPRHVAKLAKNMKQVGYIDNPIKVNRKGEVADGQHRLEAAKQAGVPIIYQVGDYTLDDVHALNMNQTNWKAEDYYHSYCDLGKREYLKLKKFREEYPEFLLVSCIGLSNNKSANDPAHEYDYHSKDLSKSRRSNFKSGRWKGDFKTAKKLADRLREIGKYFEDYNHASFVKTMIYMYKLDSDLFTHEEFIAKLKAQPGKLVQEKGQKEYKELIQKIYNYKRSRKDKVVLT